MTLTADSVAPAAIRLSAQVHGKVIPLTPILTMLQEESKERNVDLVLLYLAHLILDTSFAPPSPGTTRVRNVQRMLVVYEGEERNVEVISHCQPNLWNVPRGKYKRKQLQGPEGPSNQAARKRQWLNESKWCKPHE